MTSIRKAGLMWDGITGKHYAVFSTYHPGSQPQCQFREITKTEHDAELSRRQRLKPPHECRHR